MSDRFIAPSAALYDYVVAHGTPPDNVQRDLIDETHAALPQAAGMQIGLDQGTFLTMLVKIIGVRAAVEVGTFTGYSSLAIARGLGPVAGFCVATCPTSSRQSRGVTGTGPASPIASNCGSRQRWKRCNHCRRRHISTSRSSTRTRVDTCRTGPSSCRG